MPVILNNNYYCTENECTPSTLPDTSSQFCNCLTVNGRINDLFFVPCSEATTEVDAIDPDYWAQLVVDDKLRRMGVKGIGGFAKDSVTTADLGGCGTEVITEIQWAITWKQYCIDQSTLSLTHAFACALLEGAVSDYNVYVRPCADADTLYPIGKVSIGDFDFNLPESTSDKMYVEYKFLWKSICPPTPFAVPGLTAAIPPAK